MKKKVKILGAKYSLRRVNLGEDEYIDSKGLGGYCNGAAREIVILNLKTLPDLAKEPPEVLQRQERETLRHEIIHAFLNESGLGWNTLPIDKASAKSEEMVDWIAKHFHKILEVFKAADCL